MRRILLSLNIGASAFIFISLLDHLQIPSTSIVVLVEMKQMLLALEDDSDSVEQV